MNILLLTQEYPPETGWGGIGTYTYNLAHAFAARGHRVHVVSSAVSPSATTQLEQDGIIVHRIRRKKFDVPVLRRALYSLFPWTKHQWEYIYSVTPELTRIAEKYSIDVIEAPEIWAEGLLYRTHRQVPIVIKLHTPLFMIRELDGMRHTMDWRAVEWVDRLWTVRADHLISASASLADIVASKYALDVKQIKVIPESVDVIQFAPRREDYPAPSIPTILYVGRLEPRKGVFALAEAMPLVLAEYPQARFIFLGGDMSIDGRSCRELLQEKMRALGVLEHAEFPGKVAPCEIPKFHYQSSVSVFPSRWENCAIACLEAMACAQPVIASNAGGFPEMIQDGFSGLLIPPDEPGVLANSIKQILSNPLQAREMGKNARHRVESHFASEVVAAHTLNVYQETIQAWQRTHSKH